MGTSKGYDMPTGGDWTPLKREATQFANDGGTGPVSPAILLRGCLKSHEVANLRIINRIMAMRIMASLVSMRTS